jgi:hypothetical protein
MASCLETTEHRFGTMRIEAYYELSTKAIAAFESPRLPDNLANTAHGRDKAARLWADPGFIGIGLASVLPDAGHEIRDALLPSFLASTSVLRLPRLSLSSEAVGID